MYMYLQDVDSIFIWDSEKSQMYEIRGIGAIPIKCSLEQLSRFNPYIEEVSNQTTKPIEIKEYEKRINNFNF